MIKGEGVPIFAKSRFRAAISHTGLPIYAKSRFRAAISHFHRASNDSKAIASCQQPMLISHETIAITPTANEPLLRRPIYLAFNNLSTKTSPTKEVIEVVEGCTKEKGDFIH